MSLYSQLFLRETASPYGDINRNSTLSFRDLDQNFIFLKERDINQLKVVGSNLIYETLGGTEYSVNIGGASTNNTFVTGFTFNSPSTYDLTIEQNQGEPPLTVDLSSLASDVYVLSGTYDPSTGDVEFTNSTGGTFVVSGFTTGMTDSYTDAATLNGNTIEFDNNIQGSNFYNVDLTPVISGFTTGNTLQEVLDNGSSATLTSGTFQVDVNTGSQIGRISSNENSSYFQTDNGSITNLAGTEIGVSYLEQTDGTYLHKIAVTTSESYIEHNDGTDSHKLSFTDAAATMTDNINSKGLVYASDYSSNFTNESLVTKRYVDNSISGFVETTLFNTYTGDTETVLNSKLNISDFNSYSGSVQTQLDTKIETASNVGGGEGLFSGKSGTDLQFRTISGGTNTTISTIDDVIRVDVSVPVDTNTFITGFTYDDINTFTITRNDGTAFTETITVLSATTISGGTFYGDGSNLSGISTDNFYVTGGTLTDGTLTLERNDNQSFDITGFTEGCEVIVTNVGTGNSELYSLPLSANTGAFFDYVVSGSTGVRSGSLTTVFSGNSANIADLSTDDIGDTSDVSFNVTIAGGEANLNVSAVTGTWRIEFTPTKCDVTSTVNGGEVNTASNVGSGEGIFSGKSGTDLQFKTLTSTGGTVTITSTGSTVNLESSGGGGGGVSFGNFGQIPVTNVGLDDFDYTSEFTFNGTTLVVNNTNTNANLINAYQAGSSSTNGFLVQARGDVSGSIDSIKYRISRFGSSSVLFHSTSNHPLTLGAGTSSASNSSFHIFQSGNVAVGTIAVTDPSSKFLIKGSNDLVSGSNLKLVNNSENTLFEVKNDGTVVIPNVGSTTPVTNLAVDASGNVVSGTTGGGGSSLWTDDGGGKISYSDTGAAVEIYETGFGNTYGSQVTIRQGFLMVGEAHTVGSNFTSTFVDRSVLFGGDHTIGNIGSAGYAFAAGYNNTIEEGLYNVAIGGSNTIKNGTDNGIAFGTSHIVNGNNGILIGHSNESKSGDVIIVGNAVKAGDSSKKQIAFGNSFDVATAWFPKGFYVGFGSASNSRPSFGLVRASGLADTQPLNLCMGSNNAARSDSGGAVTNAGSGVIWQFKDDTYSTIPTANPADGVAHYTADRATGKAGYEIKVEDGTKHFFGDFSVIGGGNADANTNKVLTIAGSGTGSGTSSLLCEDSAGNTTFEVNDEGVSIFKSFTVTEVSSLSAVAGGFIYVSDETGGPTMAFSDGTNWRRVQDRAIVS